MSSPIDPYGSSAAAGAATASSRRRPAANPLIPLALLVLALLDLRIDLRLLIDHFTFTSLAEAVRFHPLAVLVLTLIPSLWRRYCG